ncbi:MAG: DUF262 domain-containing HNH endonuclease family protein [Pirellulales bacterium]|nr:DUF262 domain-containing HNH endonuclease family protein [Alphaproteobacteria bacterium]MDA8041964.1 DUF262 domain-containing HNH endonuclease family protein [Pirellulales bacterium]
MKALKAEPESIGKIFQGYKFIIPEYQRPYSWGAEECDKLWDDISSFFLEKEGNENYFLGSMVVHPLNQDGRVSADTWCIIDGQQRVTTLMILIKILFEKAATMKFLESCLHQVDANSNEVQREKLRLDSHVQPSAGRDDRRDLRCIMGKEESFTPKSPFEKNYNHLQEKVSEWFSGKSSDQINKFIETFRDHVVLLPLVCSEQDDALELFQIINDRGMHLGDADIFKAKMYSAIDSEKEKESFIKRWGALHDHDSLFRAFMHISRADANDFSKEIALRKYVNGKHMGKAQLKNNWESILRCLEVCFWVGWDGDICSDAAMQAEASIYWQILACYPNTYWQYPLYVLAHKHTAGKAGNFSLPESAQQEYIALLKDTVRYFYIRGVVHNSVNAVKDTAYKACAAIANGRDCAAVYRDGIDQHDKDAFARKLTEGDLGRCRGGLILINSLPADPQDRIAYAEVLLGKYHVEHILPRKWADYDKWDAESHAEFIDKIGNLIPLERKINIAASNEFFRRKQGKYKKSKVRGVLELSEKKPARWYPEDVKDRHAKSLERLRGFFGIG